MVHDASTKEMLAAAARNYAGYPAVCGVSYGSKFRAGLRVPNISAVQFFVTEKVDAGQLKRCLPRYVFSRSEKGTIDRSNKIPTDVIELRNMEMACVAGDEVAKVGGSTGTATLLFQNRQEPRDRMMLTCSHVASELSVSPSPGELRGGNQRCLFRAEVLANTSIDQENIVFDIALAKLTEIDDFVDGASPVEGQVFIQYEQPGDLDHLSTIDCASKLSGERNLRVESENTTFKEVKTPSGDFVTIHNLFACRGLAQRGDSGAIVFRDNRAIGIVVAKADDDWVFVHSLKAAVEHLTLLSGISIDPFGTA